MSIRIIIGVNLRSNLPQIGKIKKKIIERKRTTNVVMVKGETTDSLLITRLCPQNLKKCRIKWTFTRD